MKAGLLDSYRNRRLVRAFLRRGDESAFLDLYREHCPYLYAMALRLTGGHEHDAKDIVQETWIRACRSLPGFEWRSSLRTWLAGILINRSRELMRTLNRETLSDDMADIPAPVSTAPTIGLDLERAIAQLPDGCRAVLVLHDVEGYTHAEIGTLLGIEPGTSKSQLFRARRAVRAMLATTGE